MLTDLGLVLLPRIRVAAGWMTAKAVEFEAFVDRWAKLLDPGEDLWDDDDLAEWERELLGARVHHPSETETRHHQLSADCWCEPTVERVPA